MRISYSKVNTFKSCPQKYYLSKKWPLDINASALPFGKAVENGVDKLLEGKTLEEAQRTFWDDWHVSPKTKWGPAKSVFDDPDIFYYANDYDENLFQPSDITQVESWFAELDSKYKQKTWQEQVGKFQGQVKNDSYIEPEERKFAHRVIHRSCARRGMIMLSAFERDMLPEIEDVIAAQKQISIKNGDGDEITGYADYILKLKGIDEPILIDLKTAGKQYSNHDLNTSDQLGIYATAEKLNVIGYMILLKTIKHNKVCDKCNHVRVNTRKRNCEKCDKGKYTKIISRGETQLITRDLRKGEQDELLEDFSDILTMMKEELNYKNPKSCYDFGKRCDYYDFCWGKMTVEDLDDMKKKS